MTSLHPLAGTSNLKSRLEKKTRKSGKIRNVTVVQVVTVDYV
jgi:hypothetical protein